MLCGAHRLSGEEIITPVLFGKFFQIWIFCFCDTYAVPDNPGSSLLNPACATDSGLVCGGRRIETGCLLFQIIIGVQLYDDRLEILLDLAVVYEEITEHDDPVADRSLSGRRSVKAEYL
jgi:hypothetical protein